MPRLGMLIDSTKCVGCYACRVACQMQNELEKENRFIIFVEREKGTFPTVTLETLPVQCQHCENPPCEEVCPTKATYLREDGVVLMNEKRCIGCKYCQVACPYQARTQIHKTGVVEKCRFCIEEVEQGKMPVCVSTCICDARIFGDLDDPSSDISKAIISKKATQLRPDLGTKPKIFYVR